jgi:hypothetical protein
MRLSRKLSAVAAGVIALAVAGVAFAAWTASGTGSGAAQATSASAVTYSNGTTTAQLFPTGSGDLVISVHNPNGYKIQITDVVSTGATTVDAGHSGCNASSVALTAQHSLTKVVAANTTADVTLTGSVTMDNTANDSCQGATFTIPVSVTAASTT